MKYDFELIQYQDGLPIKAFIQSISKYKLHWHKEMEIILVLKGSIHVHIEKKDYILEEGQIILVNSNEIHSTNAVSYENILLVFQISEKFWNSFQPGFKNIYFKQKSLCRDEEINKALTSHLSKIVWELNKKAEGYQFEVMSSLNLLIAYMIKNYRTEYRNDENRPTHENNLIRLNRIMEYINNNYTDNISLHDIARNEYVNFYYLSHFFKDNVGMPFRLYLNHIRLEKAMEAMSDLNRSISEIALSCGFSSIKMLDKYFKEKYHCAPNEYRKNRMGNDGHMTVKDQLAGFNENNTSYISFSTLDAIDKIIPYLRTDHRETLPKKARKAEVITIDTAIKGKKLHRYWEKLTTFGRAVEGLRGDWQEQLREMQKEIGFEYIRFHGIFNDEMMIFNRTDTGETIYNWSYADKLFDFFAETKIKPFLELSFMPSYLAQADETVFWWKGNISMPKSIELWTDMIQALIRHCINRYGLEEVESWYFEVWNEPDFEGICWSGSRHDYFEFYKATALAIRSVSARLKIGGPAITHGSVMNGNWLDEFIAFCNRGCIPLDFISFHIYPEKMSLGRTHEQQETNRTFRDQYLKNIRGPKPSLYGSGFTGEIIRQVLLKFPEWSGKKPEFHVTEWNASFNKTHFIRDTAFMAPFIIKNVLECNHTVDSLGFWTFTDIMEENRAGISPFHGGLGMINAHGIKKPAYFAYYLLSKLGNVILRQDDHSIATKSGENIQILFYNDTYFDRFAMNGDISALTATQRYSVFEEKSDRNMDIIFQGLSGKYKVTRYELNKEHGSAFDEWMNMGSPEFLTEEEAAYLKKRAFPEMTIQHVLIENDFSIMVDIPLHGCVLVILEKEY